MFPPGPDVRMPGVAAEAAAHAVPLLRNGAACCHGPLIRCAVPSAVVRRVGTGSR